MPRLGPDVAVLGNVTVSNLFDPRAPHVHTMSTGLSLKESRTLSVAIAIEGQEEGQAAVVQPGANATITVNVTKAGVAVEEAEVTVLAGEVCFP